MPAFNRKLFVLFAASGTLAARSNSVSMAAPDAPAKASVDANVLCRLQPAVQSNMKIPLSLFKADDSHSDDTYADDPTCISCTFDSHGKRVTLIMRARNDAMERDQRNELTPVSGYGDPAFYSGEKGGQLHRVDAVRGGDYCEALPGVESSDLRTGDFSQTGGQICVAALAAR